MDDGNGNKPYKQRFKGVENFLRRVAFNLGNSPSQTEVKIISCIPIDVTDLQHRIQHLEKQLQEVSKKKKLPRPPRPPETPPPQSMTPPPTGWGQPPWQPPMWPTPMMSSPMMQAPMMQSPMMPPMWGQQSAVCPPMSPLSTQPALAAEKSPLPLSTQPPQATDPQLATQQQQLPPCPPPPTGPCIWTPAPIDDKFGAVGDKASKPNKDATVVQTALFAESYSRQSIAHDYSSDKSSKSFKSRQKPACSGCCSSKTAKKSNVSFVFPAVTTEQDNFSSCVNLDLDEIDRNLERDVINHAKKRKKKRVSKKKSKPKTQLVYFAQNKQNNPFTKKCKLNQLLSSNENAASISHAYLDNVIRKQYDPKFVVQEFSDTSHFSRPICRDSNDNSTRARQSESDMCSCCHGRFQNVDNYMPKGFDCVNNIAQYDRSYDYKTYYDSNLYDVIPVRENTKKILKESILPKREIEIRCWPERFRYKYRYDPKPLKFQAETQLKRRDKSNAQKIKPKEKLEQSNAGQKRVKNLTHETNKVTLNSSINECDKIYKSLTLSLTTLKKAEPILPKTILLKNELLETDNINTKLVLNNRSTQIEIIPDENKTELTLNQIKNILQTVLAEVKTSIIGNAAVEIMPKKDAIVQKGSSENTMQGQSTLLHSFTYNQSYNTNPYLPCCSRQVSTGQYCMPYQPSLKYLQNFPVFVHPSGRRLCTCYHKNSSHKSTKNVQASMAATNTDKDGQSAGNKETEKLIKEIYKSMAMSVDFPTKKNSINDYDDRKSATHSIGAGGVGKRGIEVEALISSNVSTISKLVTAPSSQSDDKEHHRRSARNEPYHERILQRFQQHSTDTIVEDDEEANAPSDETEDDDIVDVKECDIPPKNEKKSLLQRMFKSVKIFRRSKAERKIQVEECDEPSGTSDSEDYETVYSGRTAVLPQDPKQHNRAPKTKTTGQNALNRTLREKGRRSPYLEQEYRRHWNEGIMFEKQEGKHSSKRTCSKQSPREGRPIYWNNYEARAATVQHNLPSQLTPLKTKASKKLKRDSLEKINEGGSKDRLLWLKKHKLRNCGEQWKRFVLEN